MSARWAKKILQFSEIELASAEGFKLGQFRVSDIAGLSRQGVNELKIRLAHAGLQAEVFESPLPEGVNVMERGFNTYAWIEYLKDVFTRVAELGCKTMVWNDGRSRILPEEGKASVLKENFNQFLFMAAEVAQKNEIIICFAPQGPQRANFLNSVQEITEVLNSVGKKNLQIMISSTDLEETRTKVKDVLECKEFIAHAVMEVLPDIDDAQWSRASVATHDFVDGKNFLAVLKRVSYSRIVTLPSTADSRSLTACERIWQESLI